VVGLYLDPPANAVVVSVDEKSQIQALDRTAPPERRPQLVSDAVATKLAVTCMPASAVALS
jgi:hypothetical protein